MAESLFTAIDVAHAHTEAWTKHFAVTIKNPPLNLPNTHKLLLLTVKTPCDPELVQNRAQEAANSWFQSCLFTELSECIKKQVESKEQLGFTSVPATTYESTSIQSWLGKASQPLGANAICKDVQAAVEALSKSMGLDPSNMTERKMTLIIPVGYLSQMAPAKKKIEQSYPNLKILAEGNMISEMGPFALLFCDEGILGNSEIGRFELMDSIKLLLNEDQPNAPAYTLAFPHYELSIFAPEQIAVLTGI